MSSRSVELRPPLVDLLVAVAVAVAGLLLGLLVPEDRGLNGLGVALLVAAAAMLLLRRRAPIVMLAGVIALIIWYHLIDQPHAAPTLVTAVALFLVALGSRRSTTVVAGAVVTALAAGIMTASGGTHLVDVIGVVGWVWLSLVLGQAVRWHHAYVGELANRASMQERARADEALRQLADNRIAVARELHDLLAHTVTAIHAQASVAGHLARQDDRASPAVIKAFADIVDACRDARSEVTATVNMLREPDQAVRRPAPALADLDGLAASMQSSGLAVRLSHRGEQRRLSPPAELVVYRIVQESLTNVVKHSGSRSATVELVWADQLEVRVVDTGPAIEPEGAAPEGFGIRGMTERAAAVGGRLTAAPLDGRPGFAVCAHIPLSPSNSDARGSRAGASTAGLPR